MYALMLISLTFVSVGCKTSPEKGDKAEVYVTVNGEELSKNYIGYFFYLAKDNMISEAGWNEENYDEAAIKTFWETAELEGRNAVDVARDLAVDNAVSHKVMYQQAVKEGIVLGDDDVTYIDTYIDETITHNGGSAAFESVLNERCTDMDSYKRIITEQRYIEKLRDKYDSDGKLNLSDEELNQAMLAYEGSLSDEDIVFQAKNDKFDTLATDWIEEAKVEINEEKIKEFDI